MRGYHAGVMHVLRSMTDASGCIPAEPGAAFLEPAHMSDLLCKIQKLAVYGHNEIELRYVMWRV